MTQIQGHGFLTALNTRFDTLSDSTCDFILSKKGSTANSFLGSLFVPGLNALEKNRAAFKTCVKVCLVAIVALGGYAIFSHFYLMLASLLTGVIVSLEDKTKASIRQWLKESHVRVIQPIIDNETPLERLSIAVLAVCIATIAATTIVVPATVGIIVGMQLRHYLTQKPA